MSILDLPDDVIGVVFEHLNAEDLGQLMALRTVCKRFNDVLVGVPAPWRYACEQSGYWPFSTFLASLKDVSEANPEICFNLDIGKHYDKLQKLYSALDESVPDFWVRYARLASYEARQISNSMRALIATKFDEQTKKNVVRGWTFLARMAGVLPVFAFVAFVILLSLKLDAVLASSWFVTFTPVWISIGLASWAFFALSVRRCVYGVKSVSYKMLAMLWSLFVVYNLQLVFICLKADGYDTGGWVYMLIPVVFLALGGGLLLLLLIVTYVGSNVRPAFKLFPAVLFTLALMAQPMVFAFRLDGYITTSYAVVFVPFWAAMGLAHLYWFIYALRKPTRFVSKFGKTVKRTAILAAIVAPFWIFVLLLVLKADEMLTAGYPLCFIPMYFVCLVLLLATLRVSVGITATMHEKVRAYRAFSERVERMLP